jgi:hypothetical protein
MGGHDFSMIREVRIRKFVRFSHTRSWTRVGAVACVCFLLASCVGPGGAPPSAMETVPASADGLQQLFQTACIDQRDREWVGDESARKRAQCDWFQGDGERGDCEQNADGEVSWSVRTSTRVDVSVTLSWPLEATPYRPSGPPAGLLDCTIKVPEALGPALQRAALSVAQDRGYGEPSHNVIGGYQDWIWSHATVSQTDPQIRLFHYEPRQEGGGWALERGGFGRYPGS